ncbi:MAG: hypothetical protein OSJ34_04070 [Muribaculaceae bacterium]|nr:hypothetical protein [Muribaculaceae bacterium]
MTNDKDNHQKPDFAVNTADRRVMMEIEPVICGYRRTDSHE